MVHFHGVDCERYRSYKNIPLVRYDAIRSHRLKNQSLQYVALPFACDEDNDNVLYSLFSNGRSKTHTFTAPRDKQTNSSPKDAELSKTKREEVTYACIGEFMGNKNGLILVSFFDILLQANCFGDISRM
jgi:hypothetical protein